MDKDYSIRKATLKDVYFLADVIIGAEKSMTDKLGLATLFDLSESELKKYIISMLEEEIDGCEFSISSFFVVDYNGKPCAALGGWLEGYYDGLSSSLLKSNLIGVTFPKEKIIVARDRIEIIKNLQFEKEMGAYQLEYSYVDIDHRGKRLTKYLMKRHLDYAKKLNPNVKKAQLQPFENNKLIIRVHEKSGYVIVKRFVSDSKNTIKYMPYNVKLLMEKEI